MTSRGSMALPHQGRRSVAVFLSDILRLLLLASYINPALSAAPRYAALDNAAVLPVNGAGFAPRWYMQGTPAMPALRLSPNPNRILDKRQVQCAAGSHSCVEAHSADACCPNDKYCFIDENWETKCCSLGVTCPGSLCGPDQLYCNQTSTLYVPLGAPVTSTGVSGSVIVVSSMATYSKSGACCNRPCSESSFSCAQTYGGQCCPYGFDCGTGGQCIADPTPTSTSVSTLVSEVPPGCTTSQITCAASDGGGCCDIGSTCTYQSIATATSSAVCAPNLTLADAGGSYALSSGAKAGIGVGVSVGAAAIIAAVTWLCIRQRQRRPGGTSANRSALEMGAAGPDGGSGVGGAPGGSRPGKSRPAHDSRMVAIPPWAFRRSSLTGESELSGASPHPRPHDHGLVYNYHGPDAVPGPYTEREGGELDVNATGVVSTPPTVGLPSDETGRFVTAGSMPFSPDYFMRSVELGDNEAHQEDEDGEDKKLIPEEMPASQYHPKEVYELPGDLEHTSPLDADETSQMMNKGPSPPPAGGGTK
ncbi:hypothetical protein F5Y19DRAFT_257360 [Xylariaceae sp. FL1651]|nr:hypothetical protein F5Y19DRAFT_257360 [Xylariaceae sp. FL1651]